MNPSFSFARRRTVLAAGLGALAAPGLAWAQSGKPQTLRIGYQKSSTLTVVLKTRGTLEPLLAPLNAKISWHEFSSGLPLLEALNLGNIDFSADVADTVPVFAQAAGAQLTFVAQEAPSPSAQAIVVRADSPLRSVADLRGRKVGFAKAAGAHYLLMAALEKAGLGFKDIEPAYLSPADGRAAFERGAIDAWVIWDPFLAAVQRQTAVRVLADGQGIALYQRYYLASTPYAQARADVLRVLLAELQKAGAWVKQHPREAAQLLAPVWGLDGPTVEQANARRSYDVRPVLPDALSEQQRIADAFFAEKLLPKRVHALDVPLFKPAG
ncbi:MAG: aliphatic sulfonate ABC transporter substrate-binding protein [Burkholderiaceae bacterium]|nr:aliphatic sulfonate ABC transporter substrate-binding protein [Burkholderiaceae bacterium]